MKRYLLVFSCFILIYNPSISQTNVSGGIYSNTTWHKANTPYIVTANVVVFPGYTLTIEPGVVVRFYDSTSIEIRGAVLNAIGTKSDSITFTSNSISPSNGIWGGITITSTGSFHINYCVFKYANTAINGIPTSTIIKHCSFYNNSYCLWDVSNRYFIDSCFFLNNDGSCVNRNNWKVTNCIFINNLTAVIGSPVTSSLVKNCIFCGNEVACSGGDTILNCLFSQNHIILP